MTIDDHPWTPDLRRENANLEQTVILLEARLIEQEAATRKWLGVVKKQRKVIDTARQAVRWWANVVDHYPTLSAPWVGTMNVDLAELDGDQQLAATLAERIGDGSIAT